MELKTSEHGSVRVVHLEGRLDVHLSIEVEQAVDELISSGIKFMVFDLAKVEHLSSSGLRIFIAAMRRLKNEGGMLKLSSMSDSVKKIFRVVELYDLFDVHPTTEAAVASF